MSQNVFAVPHEVYQGDLPSGFECTLYVGRMVGKLAPVADTPSLQQFSFEIHDAKDSTEMLVRYTTYEAPAAELARWENAGDTVGIVITHKEQRMYMLLAYNFTRRKWFATGYYPHARDYGLDMRLTVGDLRKYSLASVLSVFLCGIGFILFPVMLLLGMKKTQRYKMLNPTGFRGVSAKRIADWITAKSEQIAQSGNPALDPSL